MLVLLLLPFSPLCPQHPAPPLHHLSQDLHLSVTLWFHHLHWSSLGVSFLETITMPGNPLSMTLKINIKPAIVPANIFFLHVFIAKCSLSLPTLPYRLSVCSFISKILEQLPFAKPCAGNWGYNYQQKLTPHSHGAHQYLFIVHYLGFVLLYSKGGYRGKDLIFLIAQDILGACNMPGTQQMLTRYLLNEWIEGKGGSNQEQRP